MLFAYDCVNTAFFVVLAYLFVGIFLKPRQMSNKKLYLIILGWIVTEIGVVCLFENIFILKALFTIVISFVYVRLIYDARISKIMILAFLEYCLFISFDLLAYLLAIKISSYVYIFDADNTIMSIYCGTASELLFLLVLLAIRLFFRKSDNEAITTSEFFKLSVFPVLTLSLIIAIGYFSYGRTLDEQEIWFYIYMAIVFLVSNIYMYWLLRIDVENRKLKEKSLMFELYARDLTSLYEQIREEHREIAGIEHEYKNHMTVINSLVSDGSIQELQEYLNELRMKNAPIDIIDTGNSIVSALFNAKYSEAVRKGIRVRFDIGNLNEVKVTNTDLVIILSNLFNNAIEACEKCKTDRVIDIKITNRNDLLFISFVNNCESNGAMLADKYTTTKENAWRHGFGLNNVINIVDSYNGQIDIDYQEQRFIVRILIPSANL